jgi:hydroxyacylglutathione hydrolase
LKTWKTKSGYNITRLLGGRSNVFLLRNRDKTILIDTSVSRLWNKLQKQLAKAGVRRIDYLILTHAHFDHTGNARQIREKYGALVFVQKNEAAYLSTGDNILPKGTNFFTRQIVNIAGKRLFRKFRYEPCPCDIQVDEFLDLKEFGFKAYIMHTPGHTSGSLSIVVDDEIALVGDTLFGVLRCSVFPPYAEDATEMVKSWGKLLGTNCSVFIPSHGSAISRTLIQKEYNKKIK